MKKLRKNLTIYELGLKRRCRKATTFALTFLHEGNTAVNWEKVILDYLLKGIGLYNEANYNKAKRLFERSLNIAKEKLGASHVLFADIYTNLGVLEKCFRTAQKCFDISQHRIKNPPISLREHPLYAYTKPYQHRVGTANAWQIHTCFKACSPCAQASRIFATKPA